MSGQHRDPHADSPADGGTGLVPPRRDLENATVAVVVEREGCHDALVLVPSEEGAADYGACTLRRFKEHAAAQLELHGVDGVPEEDVAALFEVYRDGERCADEAEVADGGRVEVRFITRRLALAQLKAMGVELALEADKDYDQSMEWDDPGMLAVMDALVVFEEAVAARDADRMRLFLATGLLPSGDAAQKINDALVEDARAGREPAARALLDLGADAAAEDRLGGTALMYAAQGERAPLCAMLLDALPQTAINQVDRVGRSALHYAADAGREEAALALVHAGADVSRAATYSRRTPLIAAAEQGLARLCAALLAAGAEANLVDVAGSTALLHAVGRGHEAAARAIIAGGAAVDQRSALRVTPLMAAAAQDLAGLCEALVGAGARLCDTDPSGSPALVYAADAGAARTVESLLQLGADANASTSVGRTPLIAAAEKGFTTVCALLIDAGADSAAMDSRRRTALIHALDHKQEGAAKMLLSRGGAVCADVVTSTGRTPLMYAAERGSVVMCDALLALGGDVNAASHAGMTPLLYAAKAGHAEVCSRLLTADARRDAVSACGRTALKWAEDNLHVRASRVLKGTAGP